MLIIATGTISTSLAQPDLLDLPIRHLLKDELHVSQSQMAMLFGTKGRLIAILLTGGEAHDCPVVERLIRRVKLSKCRLGATAYDSANLREELDEHGTKPVIPNRRNRRHPF